MSELSVRLTCSWHGWIVFFKLQTRGKTLGEIATRVAASERIPIVPSITLLGAGASNVDVARRARNLKTVVLAEDRRMQRFDTHVTGFR